jgi:hypothetical protein
MIIAPLGPISADPGWAHLATSHVVVEKLAPRLHVLVDLASVRGLDEAAAELVGFANAEGSSGGVGLEDDADVHLAHEHGVIVEQPDEARLGIPVGHHLLVELTTQSLEHAAVLGIEVTPDAQRVTIVKAGITAGLRALHEEQPLTVSHQQVRDDLLPTRVLLSLAAGAVLTFGSDEFEVSVDVVTEDAFPGAIADDAGAREPEDELPVLVRQTEGTVSSACSIRSSGSSKSSSSPSR